LTSFTGLDKVQYIPVGIMKKNYRVGELAEEGSDGERFEDLS
jgi:hypothetical protein